ncbi:hypothetical protein ACFLS9_00220 [Bacteroidota bacterium]
MKIILTSLVMVFLSISTIAQYSTLRQYEGLITGGVGPTWIDGETYFSFYFRPEFEFSNFGIGLDLKLEFDSNGELREENFNEFSDYASIIRYVRYGRKSDPVYVRLGSLDYTTLGHGSIMYFYNNSPSYDTRKIGLEFDIDFGLFGFETMYSNFARSGVAGIRGFLRPLKLSSAGSIPILGNLEIGATFVGDFNEYAGVISGEYDNDKDEFIIGEDLGNLTAYGLDVGLPVISGDVVDLELYFDYAKLTDFGDGISTGFILSFNGMGLVDAGLKFERRFNGENYIPSYFNSLYEIERFEYNKVTNTVYSKVQSLQVAESVGNGFYGELLVSVLNIFDILGSYQRLDDNPDSGILHFETDISPVDASFVARAGYDKINIKDEGDIFTLDDRSYLFTEIGYKPMEYLLVSLVYNWTFTPVRDSEDNIIDYKTQKKIEPRISFVYPISY